MRVFGVFTFLFFSLCIHLTVAGIFRRYVRKHRPAAPRIPHEINHMLMSRSRMMGGPPLIERQFRIRQRPWPMYVRRPRAPPLLYHYQSLQGPLMLQTVQSLRPITSRASRRLRFHDRLEMSGSSRVPQFHHQPLSARHHLPIGISSTTRLPTSAAVVPPWRPLDYGNPIDRDPTYDYAPPAIERVRFVSEVRGRGHPTARANNGMLGMYSRPAPVVVPAPWGAKRENMAMANHVRSRHPAGVPVVPHHPYYYPPPPPPPRGALPLWKILAHKQRPRRPQRPAVAAAVGQQVRPQQPVKPPVQPTRYLGQDPNHPLYHHQVFQRPSLHSQEAEVFPHIPNIQYFKPTDVSKTSYAKKTPPVKKGSLKPGSVVPAQLYSKEVASSSEFRPIKRPTARPTSSSKKATGNKAYQFTVVGYHGPSATTPMSPVAAAPSTSTTAPVAPTSTTKRSPTVLYAVKTTPETLSTTHNSVVKPLEPTESLEPDEEAAEASELQPVHVLPSSIVDEIPSPPEVMEDGREQGGLDVDFDNLEEVDSQSSGPAPVPVVPNSFNVFESLLSSFEKQFGGDTSGDDDTDSLEDEILEVKDTHSNSHQHHHQRMPVFEPAEESTLRAGLLTPAEIMTTTAPSRNSFETSTSISVSVGVSSSSSSSSKSQNGKNQKKQGDEKLLNKEAPFEGTDGLFSNIRTVPTTTTTAKPTTSTTTTTTSERPTTTERTTTSTVSTSTAYPRLPTMPTYKRKPTPVYARKSSKAGGLLSKYSSSSSSISKEVNAAPVPNGSGEVVIITAGRSKVKEYKPQVIANQTHLLAFDKVVADAEGSSSGGVKESPILLSSRDYASSPSSTSTTKSPLEDFDAMQLLHSWLNKA